MKIGIEAERANIDNPTGVEHYARQLILNIAKLDHENSYILYLRSKPQQWILDLPGNFEYKVIPFPIFWTQLRISWELLLHPVDALLIMASALPIIHPKNSVVTIHDIAWEFYPETFSKFMRNYLKFSTWYAVKFARRVIAVSQQTKKDLVKKYNLPEGKIEVIYHGFDQSTETQVSPPEERAKIEALPEKFVIYVSTLQPRKNVLGLIQAFIELKQKKQIPHSLVIVGGKGWLDTYSEVMKIVAEHPEIVYSGYAHDRLAYIGKADLLVLPSFYEGFGMTILDAFSVGVPVATSNVSSMPEVAGDAAEYFDPHDRQSMQDAIHKVISDRGLHDQLALRGTERLKQFTWQKCAEQTINVLKGA